MRRAGRASPPLATASAETLAITDGLLKIIQEIDPGVTLKYNKHYIGLAVRGRGQLRVVHPAQESPIIADFKIIRSEKLDQRIEDAGIKMLTYRARYGQYRLQIDQEDLNLRGDSLRDLTCMARDHYYGS